MLNPQSFAQALERTIQELGESIADLERDVAPVEQALSEVDEELRRIERAWIKGRLLEEELREMEQDAQARRERLQARLNGLGATDLEELERSRRLIQAAEESLEMARTAQGGWWSHREAPPVWFTDVLGHPGWPCREFMDEEVPEGRVYDTMPDMAPAHTARTLTEALNRLQG